MTRFEKPADFGGAYPYAHTAPGAPTIKTLVLLAALLVYAAGFVILYPRCRKQRCGERGARATTRRCCSSSALDELGALRPGPA